MFSPSGASSSEPQSCSLAKDKSRRGADPDRSDGRRGTRRAPLLRAAGIVAVLCLASWGQGWAARTQTLQLAERFGISYAEALAYEFLWVVKPEAIPESIRPFVSVAPRGTTPLLYELGQHCQDLPPALRKTVQELSSRPPASVLPLAIVSPKGRFRIHYTLSGSHATTTSFVEAAAEIFEHCWDVEVGELGFRPPPDDQGVDGPEYDVYIMNINDYGYTTAESEIPQTPQDDWTSFIVVDNDFSGPRYFTRGIQALKVTAAHELFHAIHFGYRCYRQEDVFFYEASGVWMEDVVYDEVNDYYQYLPSFFAHPDKPFPTADGWHEYGLSLWNKMLERVYGREVLREIWERMVNLSAIDAMTAVLKQHGDGFERALAEFQVWNYFTASRADTTRFYPEGHAYPELRFNHEVEVDSAVTLADSTEKLAGTFLHFRTGVTGRWMASLDFDLPSAWICGVAVWDADGLHWAQTPLGARDLDLGYLGRSSTFLVVPVNVSHGMGLGTSRLRFQIRVQLRPSGYTPRFQILDPAPNPFRPEEHGFVYLEYVLDQPSEVRIAVTDALGSVVREESLGSQPEGLRRMYRWDGRNRDGEPVASGVYLVHVIAGGQTRVTKVAVVR
ncbi:MAG: hypothetical protein ONB23_02490 [candidate division KSB1 bacterium]|nr:hypothetical protein [candidate division KSB1 bacterium]